MCQQAEKITLHYSNLHQLFAGKQKKDLSFLPITEICHKECASNQGKTEISSPQKLFTCTVRKGYSTRNYQLLDRESSEGIEFRAITRF
jgi:hypothetical protein